ncbi:MAG TPA: sigma-70 family RNA polymerase sigma factor [Longimicrobiales bacterium]|nr:sigma-70 family RNA polymerase sigma factor [Longimicrobiales bacterium]
MMDEAAFEALFRNHYGRLCAFAMTVVRTREDAEDVVQQVFAHLWGIRETLRIHTSARAFLYRAVRNAALNRIRADRPMVALLDSPSRHPVGDPSPDPSETVEARGSADALNAALDQLGAGTREVLRLRWIDGLTHAEIAETLGITRKAVESGITRGLSALRSLLGGAGG